MPGTPSRVNLKNGTLLKVTEQLNQNGDFITVRDTENEYTAHNSRLVWNYKVEYIPPYFGCREGGMQSPPSFSPRSQYVQKTSFQINLRSSVI